MSITEIILVFYVAPMVLLGLGVFFDRETKTMGDFIDCLKFMVIPVFNIVMLIGVIIMVLWENLDLQKNWEKFRNLKIRD